MKVPSQRFVPPQSITLWSGNGLVHAVNHRETNHVIEQCSPQETCLHADGYTLARHAPRLTEQLRARHGEKCGEIIFAIAGDFDRENIPGHTDGWEEAAIAAKSVGVKLVELNTERHWKNLPQGEGHKAIEEICTANPELELGHTSYGAPASVDGDLSKEGYQGFGGHSGGALWDFLRTHPKPEFRNKVKYSAFQHYFGRKGKPLSFAAGLRIANAYKRSVEAAQKSGRIGDFFDVFVYLQLYGTRTDSLVNASQHFKKSRWWAVPTRLDEAGLDALWALCQLYRINKTLGEFQSENGLVVDWQCGPKTMQALHSTT